MREIKCRAWDEREEDSYGQAVTPKYIYDIQNTYDDENGYSFEEVLATPGLILEQFTGLYDKNGKEIYEGDILKETPREYRYRVFSAPGGFVINAFQDEITMLRHAAPIANVPIAGYIQEKCEVIGNIHENPELLEVTK